MLYVDRVLLFAFALIVVLFFLLFRPCLIILFGDRTILLIRGFLSKTSDFSKKLSFLQPQQLLHTLMVTLNIINQ